jgi:hypothetical protein
MEKEDIPTIDSESFNSYNPIDIFKFKDYIIDLFDISLLSNNTLSKDCIERHVAKLVISKLGGSFINVFELLNNIINKGVTLQEIDMLRELIKYLSKKPDDFELIIGGTFIIISGTAFLCYQRNLVSSGINCTTLFKLIFNSIKEKSFSMGLGKSVVEQLKQQEYVSSRAIILTAALLANYCHYTNQNLKRNEKISNIIIEINSWLDIETVKSINVFYNFKFTNLLLKFNSNNLFDIYNNDKLLKSNLEYVISKSISAKNLYNCHIIPDLELIKKEIN